LLCTENILARPLGEGGAVWDGGFALPNPEFIISNSFPHRPDGQETLLYVQDTQDTTAHTFAPMNALPFVYQSSPCGAVCEGHGHQG
jgi:hypothetical protein